MSPLRVLVFLPIFAKVTACTDDKVVVGSPDAAADAASSAAPDAPAWPHVGTVEIFSVSATNRMISGLDAYFGYTKIPALSDCDARDGNGCRLCRADADAGASPAPAPPLPLAGNLSARVGSAQLVLIPRNGSYDGIVLTSALWSSPATLDIQASGSDVPAFAAMLEAPGPITVTAPLPTTTLSRASPLTIAWTGGSGNVRLIVTALSLPWATVDCNFPAQAGRGSVDPARLGALAAGAVELAVTVEAGGNVVAGDWHIDLHAGSAALNPDGSEFQARQLQLQ